MPISKEFLLHSQQKENIQPQRRYQPKTEIPPEVRQQRLTSLKSLLDRFIAEINLEKESNGTLVRCKSYAEVEYLMKFPAFWYGTIEYREYDKWMLLCTPLIIYFYGPINNSLELKKARFKAFDYFQKTNQSMVTS